MKLDPNDCEVTTFRNADHSRWIVKTDLGVRIKHKPTGISVSEISKRSQNMNRCLAYERLEKLVERATPINWAAKKTMIIEYETSRVMRKFNRDPRFNNNERIYIATSIYDGISRAIKAYEIMRPK